MAPLMVLLMLASGPTVPAGKFGPALQSRLLETVLRIQDKAGRVQGTAVVVGRQKEFVYALTASHVVAGMNQIQVEWFTRSSWPKPATHRMRAYSLIADERADLALIKFVDLDVGEFLPLAPLMRPMHTTAEGRFPAATLATFRDLDLRVEEMPVLSVGCTQGKAPTCREDRTRAKRLVFQNDRPTGFFWETERETIEGRSGGPLFNLDGRLVGICAARKSGLGYYVHADEIGNFLKKGNFDWLTGRSDDIKNSN